MAITKLPSSASLKQVMDKFEEISLQDFSSIDIITASSLPSTVKNGQVCIITDVTPSKIYLDYVKPTLLESEIYIQYYNIDTFDTFNISSSNKNIKLKLRNIVQKKNGVETNVVGYIGLNDNWKPLVPPNIDIYNNGLVSNDVGSIRILDKIGNTKITLNSTHIAGSATANSNPGASRTSSGIITHTNSINLSAYKKLYVDLSCSFMKAISSVGGGAKIGVFNSDGGIIASNNLDYIKKTNGGTDSLWEVDRGVYELDISNINGEYFVGVFIDCYTDYGKDYINKCYIYRINVGGYTLD